VSILFSAKGFEKKSGVDGKKRSNFPSASHHALAENTRSAKMNFPIPPRPAYLVDAMSSPAISLPNSPLSTAPPSPSAAVHNQYEYPPSSAPSSAPASRSSSKNPLFKRDLEEDRRRRNGGKGWLWITSLFSEKSRTTGQEVELEESRGRRRRSVSHAEEAFDNSERRQAQSIVQNELERRSTKADSVASGSQGKETGWFTKEKNQLIVAFAS